MKNVNQKDLQNILTIIHKLCELHDETEAIYEDAYALFKRSEWVILKKLISGIK